MVSEERYKPHDLPINIRHYLYYDFSRYSIYFISFEQFSRILDGEDVGDIADWILSRLTAENHVSFDSVVWHMLPKLGFDIIEDRVDSTSTLSNKYIDYHIGRCKYYDEVFSFEYQIERFKFSPNEPHKSGKAKVVCEGHSFVLADSYLHLACEYYFDAEKNYIKAEFEKKKKEAFDKRWIEFRIKHKQELIEWFSPFIDNPYKFHPCVRISSSVKNGYLSYETASAIDRGICGQCTGHCQFKQDILPIGQHTQKWKEMKIDEFMDIHPNK